MSFRRHLRYRFDNLMSRGVLAQILLLAIVTMLLVLITAVAIFVFDVVPKDGDDADSFGVVTWKALMHSIDAGTLGGDSTSSWTFLSIMLFVTLGGIFVLSALIGVLNNGFGADDREPASRSQRGDREEPHRDPRVVAEDPHAADGARRGEQERAQCLRRDPRESRQGRDGRRGRRDHRSRAAARGHPPRQPDVDGRSRARQPLDLARGDRARPRGCSGWLGDGRARERHRRAQDAARAQEVAPDDEAARGRRDLRSALASASRAWWPASTPR